MKLYVDQTIATKRERLYALENEQHEVERKFFAGEFRQSWLDSNGYIVDAYGERWWVHVDENDNVSVSVLI